MNMYLLKEESDKEASTSKQDLTETNTTYSIQLIIKSMMFSYGDSYHPLKACQEFVYNLLNQQLRMIVQKAEKVAQYRR